MSDSFLHMRIDPDIKQGLFDKAEAENKKVSTVIRELITDYLSQPAKPAAQSSTIEDLME